MMNWTDMLMCEERQKDYVREATQERLVQQTRGGHSKDFSFLMRVAAWLKHHLVTDTRKSHRTLAHSSRA